MQSCSSSFTESETASTFVRLQSEKDFDKNLPCRISIVGHKNRGREFKVFFLHFVAPRQIHQIFNFLNLSNDLI